MQTHQFALLSAAQFATWCIIALLALDAPESFWTELGAVSILGMVLMMGVAVIALGYQFSGRPSLDELREWLTGGGI